MKIESSDRDVEQLLSMGYLRIPRFQRPYSWERAEVEDFWTDVIEDPATEYFIGSIVVFKSGERLFGIVDGQQRLTTITMILASLRNELHEHGFEPLAEGLHQLIERKDINNKDQYVLQTETSYPYFQQTIQNFGPTPAEPEIGNEQRALKLAWELIRESLRQKLDNNGTSGTSQRAKTGLRKRLIDIRDKILHLKLILITLDNEDDAYVIFETLNTRGRDLTVSDLVRTHLTRLMIQKNVNVDLPKERFNAIVERFEKSGTQVSINSFLHHYWLSRYEYTTEKKLYKAIKQRIRKKDQAEAYLKSLESDSELYRQIHEPETRKWNNQEIAVRDSLAALNLFRVRQQVPFVLSLLSEYASGRIKLKHVRRALQAVENFHFAFTAVTSQRSSGGISFMYALHARKLRSSHSNEERVMCIDELVKKLRDRKPLYQEFEANFCELGTSERFTKGKPLVRYILHRVSAANGYLTEPSKMTIEHLASQSQAGGSRFTEEDVAEIGNLLWVSEEINGKLKTKPPEQKLRILRGKPVFLDDYLKKRTKWGPKEIHDRSRILARLAYDEVWKL